LENGENIAPLFGGIIAASEPPRARHVLQFGDGRIVLRGKFARVAAARVVRVILVG
jgi:hypothetical protein